MLVANCPSFIMAPRRTKQAKCMPRKTPSSWGEGRLRKSYVSLTYHVVMMTIIAISHRCCHTNKQLSARRTLGSSSNPHPPAASSRRTPPPADGADKPSS